MTVLFKSDDVLEDFFHSLSVQTFTDYRLYLIDNSPGAATDNLIRSVSEKYGITQYDHIKNDGNYGVAKGNNQGIRKALDDGADYVILLNNDIDFRQTFVLGDLVNYAVEHHENIVFPKVMFYGSRRIQVAGGKFINYKGVSIGFGVNDEDGEAYNQPGYSGYAPTCFMLISRKVFDTIGYMDERYFVYYDDDDFVYRALKAGFKLYYMPHTEIFHKASFSTGGHESPFSVYQINRNRIYFIKKHFSFPLKQVALSHAITTKGIRYLFYYDKERRKALRNAFVDGFFKMKVV
ncbi:MAG: glycosyltransferase family 2 protein [Bacteroidetes bacterium]|nr:glycosyltransferase family 2 protein [Bacteroidota bacterium]